MELWQICFLDCRGHLSNGVGSESPVEPSCVLIAGFLVAVEGVRPAGTLCLPFLGDCIEVNVKYIVHASILPDVIDVEWHGGQLWMTVIFVGWTSFKYELIAGEKLMGFCSLV